MLGSIVSTLVPFVFPTFLLVCLVAPILLRRRVGTRAEAQRIPAWIWIVIVAIVAAFFGTGALARSDQPRQGFLPAQWGILLGESFVLVAGSLLGLLYPFRDNFLLQRRIREQDYAGVIATLEAKVAPHFAPATSHSEAAVADPWAAPRSVALSPTARTALAHRLNLIGLPPRLPRSRRASRVLG